MVFNSFIFIVFFVITYSLYLLLSKHYKAQNVILLIASYIFYGYWDWRFLSLLFIVTFIGFVTGYYIHKSSNQTTRKLLLMISVVSCLAILGFFKYFNFFTNSFIELLLAFGMKPDRILLNIVLPVGISFYTFQTLSYTWDVYFGTLKPTNSLWEFALFVSFFPQLVAGPIERASNLLPQILSPRVIKVEEIHAAIFLIIWGYFKKIVVADNMALIADPIFNNYTQYSGVDLFIGAFAFSVQIYCDFSAYSDIARGLAKLMGFELMINFRLPYFSRSPSEFWARWHISLSSWLRDYLYIPLGGNRNGVSQTYRNLFLTMLLGGLWHGAAWNYVIWGAYHGLILIIYRFYEARKRVSVAYHDQRNRPWHDYIKMAVMFCLVLVGWIIFRADSPRQIVYMLTNIGPKISAETLKWSYLLAFFCLPVLIVQILQYRSGNLLITTRSRNLFRIPFYTFLLVWMLVFGVKGAQEFIYFQF